MWLVIVSAGLQALLAIAGIAVRLFGDWATRYRKRIFAIFICASVSICVFTIWAAARQQQSVRETINQATGGDSFAYFMLYYFDLSKGIAQQEVVIGKGRYPLYNLSMRLVDADTNEEIRRDIGELSEAETWTQGQYFGRFRGRSGKRFTTGFFSMREMGSGRKTYSYIDPSRRIVGLRQRGLQTRLDMSSSSTQTILNISSSSVRRHGARETSGGEKVGTLDVNHCRDCYRNSWTRRAKFRLTILALDSRGARPG